ncbi:uncharacterized protein K02A2.6-like [Eupeodes corollae]|uniref:uncharacterized protein K02A2.6-like n=1 Tax=Eupeodes corollae TaxID=290404 RepID=UPI0024910875|nr:uncharacterized protein K02A2.6-like [Eupeodes corollae]
MAEDNLDKLSKNLCGEFADLFDGKLGEYKHAVISLQFKNNAKPRFCKPRKMPFAFKTDVDQEIERLVKEGVLLKIQNSEWGTPLVPVLKSNGKIRVCADYKVTVNPYLENVNHPIPHVWDILNSLEGGELFIKLDFTAAYNQIRVDEETGKKLAWSTHQGIFQKLGKFPEGQGGHLDFR